MQGANRGEPGGNVQSNAIQLHPILKDQVCNHEDFEEIDNKHNTLGVLSCMKKYVL